MITVSMMNLIGKVEIAYVVLPCNGIEGDGVDVLVENKGDGDDEVEDVETLGTETVWQDLDGVHDDEWRECKTGGRGQ